MNFNEPDLMFALGVLERDGKFHRPRTAPDGRRRTVVEAILGKRDADKLAAFLGVEARANGSKYSVRVRGTNAEELLTELMPRLSESSQGFAVAAMTRGPQK
ncbi:hypothetical protein J7E83_05740 [Arthrobacter sp. ISL-48]|uniref:hypothetical protein n=1 Tax=Arthrobacter sp. ISL-48 TaxID=2819110 RepID=UPI001BE5027E|nr:hypothetical protein [Arthrobacter sp. ISL-48]MBT2531630.1 hypothetical protein [Arthrobacter sp. ISL-48]